MSSWQSLIRYLIKEQHGTYKKSENPTLLPVISKVQELFLKWCIVYFTRWRGPATECQHTVITHMPLNTVIILLIIIIIAITTIKQYPLLRHENTAYLAFF